MPYSRRARSPEPRPRLPAPVVLMAAEVEARPFGSSGEFLVPPRPEQRTVAQPFQPPAPAPDWAAEAQERREREGTTETVASDPAPPVNPVAAMLAEAHARGEIDDPVFPGPPVEYEPLLPVAIPKADWREIEAEHQREKAAEAQEKLEPPRSTYPVPRGVEKAPRLP